MTKVVVGRWGKSLAIRVPLDVVRASGLADGEPVEIESLDGDIVVRRPKARQAARQDAQAAAAELIANAAGVALGTLSLRDLLDEGRRG
ncbi:MULTISPECIES: AbrB/MazE/SpoVT family DNA-binding domain-containing protein [unclassified Sphingomonas]|uniref:AbrB/MazE/SpoVT family DNA-binding domain-containing protein n=1 Tax=Novosphingobium rhizosphaerae TaxID=1551649 RepID=UPI0015C6E3A9